MEYQPHSERFPVHVSVCVVGEYKRIHLTITFVLLRFARPDTSKQRQTNWKISTWDNLWAIAIAAGAIPGYIALAIAPAQSPKTMSCANQIVVVQKCGHMCLAEAIDARKEQLQQPVPEPKQ